jgi:hypothetical protein
MLLAREVLLLMLLATKVLPPTLLVREVARKV